MRHARPCDCEACQREKAKRRDYNVRYRELRKTTWTPDLLTRRPDKTIAHLEWLRANGVPGVAISEASGINRTELAAIRKGRRGFVTANTEDRVLAVTLEDVPSTVMARAMVIALHDKGWTQHQIGKAAGVAPSVISDLMTGKRKMLWAATIKRLLSLDPTSPPPGR